MQNLEATRRHMHELGVLLSDLDEHAKVWAVLLQAVQRSMPQRLHWCLFITASLA
jgi:hypothetical protein